MNKFRMDVDDVFWLTGRSGLPIVVGRTHEGVATVGDELELINVDDTRRHVVLRGVELVCRPGQPPAGNPPLNLMLGDDLTSADVMVGQVLASTEQRRSSQK